MDTAQEWFDGMYRAHAPQMMRIAYRILQDETAAEDVVQNTFIVLLSKQAQVRQEYRNPAGWLYVTLRNQIGNELQRIKRHNPLPLDHLRECPSAAWESSLEQMLPKQLRDGDRQFLILYYEKQWSYEEIAWALGCSVLTCRTKLCRARARCRQLLSMEPAAPTGSAAHSGEV